MDNDDIKEFFTKFKLVCLKCGCDAVTLDAEPGVNYGGQTGYQEGTISIGCQTCKDNDVFLYQ